jgi:hypothetical protein
MKHLNRKAKLPVGSMKELVRPNLPEFVQKTLPIYGKADTLKAFWSVVTKACRANEDAAYAMKGQAKATSTPATTTTRAEAGNTNRGKETSTPNQKTKNHDGTKPEKAKPEGNAITAPRRDDKTRVSKTKREYPQVFDNFEKAQEGVPQALIRERRTAGVCTRCGKPNHDAKFCAGKANTEQAIVPPWKGPRGEPSSAAVRVEASGSGSSRRRARTAPAPRPCQHDVGDLDSDME